MTDERKQQLLNLALDSEPFDVHNHVKIVAVDDGWAQVEVEIHPETRMEACVTDSGTIDCVNAGPASGKLIATGRVQKAGGKLVFCDSEIRDETGKLITTGHTVMYFTGKQLA